MTNPTGTSSAALAKRSSQSIADLTNHLHIDFSNAKTETERNAVKDIASRIYATALRDPEISNMDLSLMFDQFKSMASAANISDNARAIGQAITTPLQQAKSDFHPENALLWPVAYALKLAEDPWVNVKAVNSSLQAGKQEAIRAFQHQFPIFLSSDERLRLADIYDLPFEQRIAALHGQTLHDGVVMGTAVTLPKLAPEVPATIANTAKRIGTGLATSLETDLPLIPAGLAPSMADMEGDLMTLPDNSLMQMVGNGSGKGGEGMRNNNVIDFFQRRAKLNMEAGLHQWELVKEDIPAHYNEIEFAKLLYRDIQGLSDKEIQMLFQQRGYLDVELTNHALFTGKSDSPAESMSIPDQASDYLHKFIKWRQNIIAVDMQQTAAKAFPEAAAYRTENGLPLPDPTLHPWEYQSADKLYTEMANTAFRHSIQLDPADNITRIPVTDFLPNQQFSTAIIIANKSNGKQALYLAQNELEIVGNFNDNQPPMLGSPYTQVTAQKAARFLDQLIDHAKGKDVFNAGNPHYTQALPKILRATAQFYDHMADSTPDISDQSPEP